jgi:hypothetical protein
MDWGNMAISKADSLWLLSFLPFGSIPCNLGFCRCAIKGEVVAGGHVNLYGAGHAG